MIVRGRNWSGLLGREAYREGGAGKHAGGVHDVWCGVVVLRRVVGMSRICFLSYGVVSKVRRSWSDAKMLTTPKHE
jgi:hypothetical protein